MRLGIENIEHIQASSIKVWIDEPWAFVDLVQYQVKTRWADQSRVCKRWKDGMLCSKRQSVNGAALPFEYRREDVGYHALPEL